MGLFDWYQFIRRKGYNPVLLYHSVLGSLTTGQRRFDVMANCYRVIQHAYSNLPQDAAHRALEKEIERFGTMLIMSLYIDGRQAVEKENTTKRREESRCKALDRAEKGVDTLEERLNDGMRIRKRHFTDIRAGLSSSFHWSLTSRQAFAEYMRGRGWDARVCETEADIAMAQDAQPKDVIISADSDLLAYASVVTLWRPVSKALILVYNVPAILTCLGITQTQLTALAVVSRNDYHKNIYSLGPATNFSIIKAVGSRPDARGIVAAYLSHSQVRVKNTQEETFENSIRVFILLQQRQVEPVVLQPPSQRIFDVLRERFKDLCVKYKSLKETQVQGAMAKPKDTDIVRLRSPKTFNRYRTVELPATIPNTATARTTPPSPAPGPLPPPTLAPEPDADGHPPLPRTRIPRNRGRYSFKERTQKIVHDPPPKSKQSVLKFYRERPETNPTPVKKSKSKGNKVLSGVQKKPLKDMDKNGFVRSLSWHHPTSSLNIGTVRANAKRVLADGAVSSNLADTAALSDVQREVVECMQEGPRLAAGVKREAQRLIGHFVETMRNRMDQAEEDRRLELEKKNPPQTMSEADRLQARKDAVTEVERNILLSFCGQVKPKDANEGEDDIGDEKEEDSSDIQSRQDLGYCFILSFMTYLYSGNYPKKDSKAGATANDLVDWLVKRNIYHPIRSHADIRALMPFTPSSLVRSVAGQLAAELKRMYGHGSRDLQDKVKTLQEKGAVRRDADIQIRDVSPVENFLYLNKLASNCRRIVPITFSQQPFVTFSERELALFFWKRGVLKERLIQLAALDDSTITSTEDLDIWISGKPPGFLIKNFVADVAPQGLTSRQKKKAGHRAAIKLWSLDQIRAHLEIVKSEWLDPVAYAQKGYVLRGSVRTDGFRVQLLAFKLRELQDVRYRRMDENRLPSRLTSTVGGVDYYLTEIRNAIASKEDVERLWPGTRVEDIKTLTLDGGQACVIGAFAHLPEELSKRSKGKEPVRDVLPMDMEGVVATAPPESTQQPTTTPVMSPRPVFFNLAVKSKAVYQPNFRFRRWLQGEKDAVPDGEQDSISNIETHLPTLRGEGASVINYFERLEKVEGRLLEFYNGPDNLFEKHSYDMERARHAEYQLIADRLFGIVGGSIGTRRDPSNPVLIGVGLGKFATGSGLSSLHSTFLTYFVQMARSLGYVVVGLNEYYTSKKCPGCGLFVAQVDMRRFYCTHCHVYHHRDVMAAENMANIAQGYLVNQERPDYLQPVAEDGSFPWKTKRVTGPRTTSTSTATGSASSTATSTANPTKGRRKRTATTLSVDLQRSPEKKGIQKLD